MKRLLLYLLLLFSLPQYSAELQYKTTLLERIASYLPAQVLASTDSIVVSNGYPCAIKKRVEGKEVTHLGFYLFNYQTARNMPETADFLERYLLELYIQGRDIAIQSKLSSQKITWKENGRTPVSLRLSLVSFLKHKDKSDNFSYSFADGRHTTQWSFGTKTYTLSYPANRQLINGTDAAESEDDIANALAGNKYTGCKEAKVMPLADLHKFSEKIYRHDGLVYNVQQKYTSDTFYEKINETEAHAYFSERHPEMSLLNMVEDVVPCGNRMLDISYHRYGGKISHCKTSLAVIQSDIFADTQKYYSIDATSSTVYYARIIFFNEMLNYVHVMEITVPVADIFNDNAVWKAHLYCNIPQNNLKKYINE